MICTFFKSLECWKIGILEDWVVEAEMISLKTDRIPSQPIISRFHHFIIPVESFTGRAIEL